MRKDSISTCDICQCISQIFCLHPQNANFNGRPPNWKQLQRDKEKDDLTDQAEIADVRVEIEMDEKGDKQRKDDNDRIRTQKKRRRRKLDAESHEEPLWLLLSDSDMNGLFRLVTDVTEITAVTEIGPRKQGSVPHC